MNVFSGSVSCGINKFSSISRQLIPLAAFSATGEKRVVALHSERLPLADSFHGSRLRGFRYPTQAD
jgi:hypothetical protein